MGCTLAKRIEQWNITAKKYSWLNSTAIWKWKAVHPSCTRGKITGNSEKPYNGTNTTCMTCSDQRCTRLAHDGRMRALSVQKILDGPRFGPCSATFRSSMFRLTSSLRRWLTDLALPSSVPHHRWVISVSKWGLPMQISSQLRGDFWVRCKHSGGKWPKEDKLVVWPYA